MSDWQAGDPRHNDIWGLPGNDLLYDLALTYDGEPLDLATVTAVTAYLNTSALAPDAAAVTYGVGTGLTVTDQALGQLGWVIPRGDVGSNRWYRVDVTDAFSHVETCLYGVLTVQYA